MIKENEDSALQDMARINREIMMRKTLGAKSAAPSSSAPTPAPYAAPILQPSSSSSPNSGIATETSGNLERAMALISSKGKAAPVSIDSNGGDGGNEQLLREIAKLNGIISSHKAEMDEKGSEIEKLYQLMAQSERRGQVELSSLNGEIERLKSIDYEANKLTQDKIAAIRKDVAARYSADIDQLQSELLLQTKNLAETIRAKVVLEEDNKQLQQQLQVLTAEADGLRNELERANLQCAAYRKRLEDLPAHVLAFTPLPSSSSSASTSASASAVSARQQQSQQPPYSQEGAQELRGKVKELQHEIDRERSMRVDAESQLRSIANNNNSNNSNNSSSSNNGGTMDIPTSHNLRMKNLELVQELTRQLEYIQKLEKDVAMHRRSSSNLGGGGSGGGIGSSKEEVERMQWQLDDARRQLSLAQSEVSFTQSRAHVFFAAFAIAHTLPQLETNKSKIAKLHSVTRQRDELAEQTDDLRRQVDDHKRVAGAAFFNLNPQLFGFLASFW